MSNPKISVIIPVYNVEKYLSECLDSVINQTLKDIEIICVNDGSTDNSLTILKDYASKDARIKIIDKKNEGQGYARKVGLDIAIGKYILFLDSDDKYISNDVFLKLYNYIDNSDFDICIFDLSYWREDSIELKHYEYEKEKIIFKRNMWMCWNKIYRKSFLDSYTDWYFPVIHHLTQDVELHVQILVRANSIGYINEPMVLYRIGNLSSATGSKFDLKRMLAPCIYIRKTHEVIKNLLKNDLISDEKKEQLKREFVAFTISQLIVYITRGNRYNISPIKYIDEYQKILMELKDEFDPYIKKYPLCKQANFPFLNKEEILFYKLMIRLKGKDLFVYVERKNLKKQNKRLVQQNRKIRILESTVTKLTKLQNSLAYRIGNKIITSLSIPLDFYRFIRDYNLIKKSGLFNSKYYLSQYEDVKKAKMDPIKHYLKFGWKEGRNPSAEFDNNEYLNKRSDVADAGICPLIHYIKFGKDEK